MSACQQYVDEDNGEAIINELTVIVLLNGWYDCEW